MSKEPKWLSHVAVMAIHEMLIAEHGGVRGLLDEGALESALAAPRNRHLYEHDNTFRLAAAYAHALIRDHPFCDGNKRVALTVAGVFLELNGYRLAATERDAVTAMGALVERELDEVGFAAWLKAGSVRVVATKRQPRKPSARPRRRTGK